MQTCLAMPGLYMDGASQALASRAVAQEELAIWRADASYGVEGYGPVYRELGLEGVAVIRSNSLCSVDESSASTATTALFLTTIVWPMSSRAISVAMRWPYSMSACCESIN